MGIDEKISRIRDDERISRITSTGNSKETKVYGTSKKIHNEESDSGVLMIKGAFTSEEKRKNYPNTSNTICSICCYFHFEYIQLHILLYLPTPWGSYHRLHFVPTIQQG